MCLIRIAGLAGVSFLVVCFYLFLSCRVLCIYRILIILLNTLTFVIFMTLCKYYLIYPTCLPQCTYWSGSSHESLDPPGLPLCFAPCPQRSIFTTVLQKSINSEEENRDHAQIFSFSHLYPAALHALQHAFLPISIADIFASHMKPKPRLWYCKLVLHLFKLQSKLWVNAKTCSMFLLVQRCL